LRQIAGRQKVGVVLDPDLEYLSEFYRPERGDVVLNPLDERCPFWTPWLELRPRLRRAGRGSSGRIAVPRSAAPGRRRLDAVHPPLQPDALPESA